MFCVFVITFYPSLKYIFFNDKIIYSIHYWQFISFWQKKIKLHINFSNTYHFSKKYIGFVKTLDFQRHIFKYMVDVSQSDRS